MCGPFIKRRLKGYFGLFPVYLNIRILSSNLLGVTPPNFCGVLMRFWTTFLNFFENFLTTHVGARGHILYKNPILGGRGVPPKIGFLYSVCPLAPTWVVKKNSKKFKNVVQNLIKTPQKFGGVTPTKFEDTVHILKTSRCATF